MKYFFLLLALMAVCTSSQANVLTCNNHNPGPGDYSTFATANTAAAGGDTIYLSSSATDYGNIIITKSITLIGNGLNPTDKQDNSTSYISVINFNTIINNCSFIGLQLGNIVFSPTGTYSGISFVRCLVNGRGGSGIFINILNVTLSNLTINGCKFVLDPTSAGQIFSDDHNPFNISNSIISNNLFLGAGTGGNSFVLGTNACNFSNVNILNNDFISLGKPFQDANYANCNIENNIFYSTVSSGFVLNITGTNTANTASNNVVYATGPVTNFNTAINTSNVSGSDPLFISAVTNNFHLQTGSPAHNESSDGTDAGIFGSALSNSYTDTGEPAIPQIRKITAPATTALGSNVNANVISTRKP